MEHLLVFSIAAAAAVYVCRVVYATVAADGQSTACSGCNHDCSQCGRQRVDKY